MDMQYLILLMRQHGLCMREIKLLKNHEAFVRKNMPGAISANNELIKYELYKQQLKEELHDLTERVDISQITKILTP